MRVILAVLAVLAVSSCTTVGELRGNEPYSSFTTSKPAKVVAECIRDGWQEQTFGGASVVAIQEHSDGVSVISPAAGAPLEIAEISGHDVTLHISKGIFESRRSKRSQVVQSCI